jgi:HEAT repeat protein
MKMKPTVILTVVLLCVSTLNSYAKPLKVPDFTKGDPVPEGFTHDWNLGPTGLRGWIYSDKLVTSDARQILITKVDPASPGDGKFAKGDVILGVGGKPFSYDPRTEFGKAVTAAEISGKLALTRWRTGTEEEVLLDIPILGAYGKTAPYDCPKSARILEEGCKALAKRMELDDYVRTQNAMTRSINALALLASGKQEYMPLIRREVKWANQFSEDSMQTWWNSFVITLLAEYKIATGDDSFTSGMNRLALDAAKGQSIVGSWGHGYALPEGNLGGYGMMNAPGVPLTIALILAREAGLKDAAVDLAIDRSAKLMRFYIGKGAVPYGDHAPWTENHEDNGKCGMAGVMFNLLGEKDGAEFFSRMSLASHGPERDCGHCGNFTNLMWAIPGVALSGPVATGAWMNEFGAWHGDLTRTWNHQFPHPGPPEPADDSYSGWDATGCNLLAYAMPLKKIMLTGKKPSTAPQIDATTAASLLDDGRGWTNKDRNSAYDKIDSDTLLAKLGSWSPTVRERAAMAISRRQGNKPIPALLKMLDSPSLYARYGACEALMRLGDSAAPAVPKLTALIRHEDLWLRVKAAETLSNIGKTAMPALPLLLERLTHGPSKSDPRGMEQRFLCLSVFGHMLKNSKEGIDRDLLRRAVTAGLRNEDGRARSSIAEVYKMLSYEDIKPLLPAILEASAKPAPSGEMFADGIRIAGLEILAGQHIAEGIPACTDYILKQNLWGSEKRTPVVLRILASYGVHAKAAIPALKAAAENFDKGEVDFPKHLSQGKAADVRKAIAAIEAATDKPELRKLR